MYGEKPQKNIYRQIIPVGKGEIPGKFISIFSELFSMSIIILKIKTKEWSITSVHVHPSTWESEMGISRIWDQSEGHGNFLFQEKRGREKECRSKRILKYIVD